MISFANIGLAALLAVAFDSAAWLQKREIMTREAERLEALYQKYSAELDSPATDIFIPIETFPDGSIRSSVKAKKAQYHLDDGYLWGEDVIIERFNEKGKVESMIKADHVLVDRQTKSGWIEGTAIIYHEGTICRGFGVYFSSPEGYILSKSKSKIISKGLKFGGAL